MYGSIRNILAAKGRLFAHCAAGIHRTGLIIYGLLRSTALTPSAATQMLGTLRAHTGEGVGRGVGEARLAWGDQFGVP